MTESKGLLDIGLYDFRVCMWLLRHDHPMATGLANQISISLPILINSKIFVI